MADTKKVQASSDTEGGDTPFRGSFFHSLDDKGRVSLPATFRSALNELDQSKVILTNFISDGARCVEGFSLDSWSIFEGKLRERSRFDPRIQKLENFYLARSCECQLDSSGRINIPQYLRIYGGLTRELVFTSTLRGFRIWDKRVWELIFSDAEKALLEDPALFMDLDI